MHGAKRVVAFCFLTAILPSIFIITPLYLRHSIFSDIIYPVAESDILAIADGISSVFCQGHHLQMNTTFNAYQLNGIPQVNDKKKHIRLKKSMILPDDTFEYWGFFLLNSALVKLKVCSKYMGARVLVVKGEKHLKTCRLMEKTQTLDTKMDEEHFKVKVTYEKPAEEIGMIDEDSLKTNNAAEDYDEDNVAIYFQNRLKKFGEKNITTKIANKSIEFVKQKISNTNNQNYSQNFVNSEGNRTKRETNLDAPYKHGGTAGNFTKEESSVSSFETELKTCYNGQILLNQDIPDSLLCTNVDYLEENSIHLQTFHDVGSDGYYYYIFYSDNDAYDNDIHTIFDIFKPTYHFESPSTEKSCINVTECTFPLKFWSDETVIVEVPTRNGIEHEEEDITYLLSRCHPRMTIYMIFPILVLFLILGCAFL
ncbi:hypothetical protein WA026_010620 [Henosepilachna vigintioctopunctata]|uniref:E3 ubiquitin-protein ligase APD1-4 middle domain-containing protein n=1 Tax=Henosepilachna vigintioctopunctata TaxID=420089 RepID=A0AAW1VBQ2_9CUCU